MSGRYGITFTRWQKLRIKRLQRRSLVHAQAYVLRIIERNQ